ncbi:hypothetical protein D3C73_635980 [compost metagenome]
MQLITSIPIQRLGAQQFTTIPIAIERGGDLWLTGYLFAMDCEAAIATSSSHCSSGVVIASGVHQCVQVARFIILIIFPVAGDLSRIPSARGRGSIQGMDRFEARAPDQLIERVVTIGAAVFDLLVTEESHWSHLVHDLHHVTHRVIGITQALQQTLRRCSTGQMLQPTVAHIVIGTGDDPIASHFMLDAIIEVVAYGLEDGLFDSALDLQIHLFEIAIEVMDIAPDVLAAINQLHNLAQGIARPPRRGWQCLQHGLSFTFVGWPIRIGQGSSESPGLDNGQPRQTEVRGRLATGVTILSNKSPTLIVNGGFSVAETVPQAFDGCRRLIASHFGHGNQPVQAIIFSLQDMASTIP